MSVKDCDLKVIQDAVRHSMADELQEEYLEIIGREGSEGRCRDRKFEEMREEISELLPDFQDDMDKIADRLGLSVIGRHTKNPVVLMLNLRYTLKSCEDASKVRAAYGAAMECESLKAALKIKDKSETFEDAVSKAIEAVRKTIDNARKSQLV